MNRFDNSCEKLNEKIKNSGKKINGKCTEISNGFFDNQRANIALILVIAFVSFFLMFLMNTSTPYAAEDYDYHYIFATDGRKITDEKIDSFADIATSMKAHYQKINGRVVTHTIVQFILMLDKKAVFNVVNSLVYVLFTFVLYKHCIGKSKKQNAAVFLFINLSIWLFVPQWGMTTVWLLGSVNYLWMSTVRLLFLLMFRLYADDGESKHTIFKSILMLVLGLIAGNSSENMSAALVGVTVLFLIYYRVKRYKIKAWSVTGLVGLLTGYGIMFFAPGNSVRLEYTDSHGGSSLMQRLINIPGNAVLKLTPLICIGLIFVFILCNSKAEKKFGLPFIYFLGSVGGTVVMFAISSFPDRAWFGIVMYSIMAVGMLIKQAESVKQGDFRRSMLLIAVFCCVWTMMSYVKAYQSAGEYMKCLNERIEYIEEEKSKGNYDLEFANIQLMNKHAPLYSLTDVGRLENDPQHISLAQYFGLNSVDWNGEYIIIE